MENVLNSCTLLEAERDTNEAAWLERRRALVGSSDISVIMGMSQWKTELELWCERTGKIPGGKDSRAARYGRKVEGKILELFAEDHPELEVIPNSATYVSKAVPFAVATPDAFVIRKEDSELGLNEVKHSAYGFEDWQDGGVPTGAHMQVIWQMGVLVLPWAYVTAIVGGRANDVIEPCVQYDDIAQRIYADCVERAAKFVEHVNSDIPPGAGPGDYKLVQRIVEEKNETVSLPAALVQSVEEFLSAEESAASLRDQLKAYTDVMDKVKAELLLAADGASRGLLPDGREVKFSKVQRKGFEVKPTSYWNVKIGK